LSFHIKNSEDLKEKFLLAYETCRLNCTAVILTVDVDFLLSDCKKMEIPKKLIYKNNEINEKLEKSIKKYTSELSKLNNTKLLVILSKTNDSMDYKVINDFIKRNKLPYVTTWKFRVELDNAGLYCGRIGSMGNHSANYALYNCENILLIGNMIEDLHFNRIEYHYDIFSIPFLNKSKNIFLLNYKEGNNNFKGIKMSFIHPNLGLILNKISIQVNNDWLGILQKSNSYLLNHLPYISLLEQYAFLASKIHSNHKLDVPVTTGVGNHWYAIGKYMNFTIPNCWESDTNWASIGIGIANGLGIYYATKKPVWVFEGDGGLLFSANNLFYLLNNLDIPMTVTIFINHIYGAVYSSFIVKGFNPINGSNMVENISFINFLPNCHFFEDIQKYYSYLNKYPISNTLRFIVINLGKKFEESLIYQINFNKKYENYLKNSMFKEILESKMTLVESDK
jgi:thiamine pyrophosphate-dependent acetolactate synthase large subunit-like protein